MLPSIRRIRDTLAAGQVAELPDAELLARFIAQRDEAAFELLVRRHQRLVWGVCRRMLRHRHDAEDAFQGTFLTLARKAKSLRSSRSLAGWLYRVAYRIALRAESRRRREPAGSEHSEPATNDRQPEPDLAPLLDTELQRLPEKYRLPVVLCYLEGHSYDEAARRLRWPKGTLSTRLTRARELLRERLSARGVSPAVVAGLLSATVEAVPSDVTRRCVIAGLSPNVASVSAAVLSDEVIRAMTLSKLQIVFPLAAVGVMGLAVWGGRSADADPRPTPALVVPVSAADEETERPPAKESQDGLHAIFDELKALEQERSQLRTALRTEAAVGVMVLQRLRDERDFEREMYLIRTRALAEKELELEVRGEELAELADAGDKEAQAMMLALDRQRRRINLERGQLEAEHRDATDQYYDKHFAATRRLIDIEGQLELRERLHEYRLRLAEAKMGMK